MNQLEPRGLKAILAGSPCSRVAATRDLPTIAYFPAGGLLRPSVPVPGILATHPAGGAIMDKSGRHFAAPIFSSEMTESKHELKQ